MTFVSDDSTPGVRRGMRLEQDSQAPGRLIDIRHLRTESNGYAIHYLRLFRKMLSPHSYVIG